MNKIQQNVVNKYSGILWVVLGFLTINREHSCFPWAFPCSTRGYFAPYLHMKHTFHNKFAGIFFYLNLLCSLSPHVPSLRTFQAGAWWSLYFCSNWRFNVCLAELNQFSLEQWGRIDLTDLLKGYFHPLPPSAAFLSSVAFVSVQLCFYLVLKI